MSAALEALALAEAHGVRIALAGDLIHWQSQGPTPDNLLAALKAAKPEIVILLRPDSSGATGIATGAFLVSDSPSALRTESSPNWRG